MAQTSRKFMKMIRRYRLGHAEKGIQSPTWNSKVKT